MAFGKKKDKKKPKKSKGSKGKKDEWNLEGGQSFGDGAPAAPVDKKARRETQDRDERFRRSRSKMYIDKQKKALRNKMSTKVSFNDVLSDDENNIDDSNGDEDSRKAPKTLRPQSALSHLDRLNMFVSKSLKKRKLDEDETQDDDDDDNDDDDENGREEVDQEQDETEERIGASNHSDDELDEEQENSSGSKEVKGGNSSKAKGEAIGQQKVVKTSLFFDSFFGTKDNTVYTVQTKESGSSSDGRKSASITTSTPSWSNLKPLAGIGDLYGALNFDVDKIGPPVPSFLKLPALHKMWQSMKKNKQKSSYGRDGDSDNSSEEYDTEKSDVDDASDADEEGQTSDISFSDLGAHLLPYLSSFSDAFLEGRDDTNDDEFVDIMASHVMAHVMNARSRVLKHNKKIKSSMGASAVAEAVTAAEKSGSKKSNKTEKRAVKQLKLAVQAAIDANALKEAAAATTAAAHVDGLGGDDTSVMHDQGFCRPRVLILCPFRSHAKQLVEAMQDLLGPNTSITGLEKFEEEFGYTPDEDEDDGIHDDSHGYIHDDGKKKKKKNSKDAESQGEFAGSNRSRKAAEAKMKQLSTLQSSKKPPDWLATFKDNTDDDFKIGIQVNPGKGKGSGPSKGAHLRLFSDFYISDIIIASPIGLRLAIEKGSSSGEGGTSSRKGGEADFLSSIEIVMLQQADVLYMQNWEHVEYVMQNTNKLPGESRDTDFSRVRPYFLEGLASEHRQLVLTTQFNDPEIQALFRQHAKSLAGQIRLRKDWNEGVINRVVNSSTQVFQRVPRVTSFANAEDVRFDYFKESILDPMLRNQQTRTLIVAPSYLHYVRIRNELMQREANAAFVCEYSRESEISRGRSNFFHGRHDFMLYSGRAHFFRRFHMRGAQHLIFYSLPQYAHFYSEIVNYLSEADADHHSAGGSSGGAAKLTCVVLFTQYDRMALERVVGPNRCSHILSSSNTMTFMFK